MSYRLYDVLTPHYLWTKTGILEKNEPGFTFLFFFVSKFRLNCLPVKMGIGVDNPNHMSLHRMSTFCSPQFPVRSQDQSHWKYNFQCNQQDIAITMMLDVIWFLNLHIIISFACISMLIFDCNWPKDSRAITRAFYWINSKLVGLFSQFLLADTS